MASGVMASKQLLLTFIMSDVDIVTAGQQAERLSPTIAVGGQGTEGQSDNTHAGTTFDTRTHMSAVRSQTRAAAGTAKAHPPLVLAVGTW